MCSVSGTLDHHLGVGGLTPSGLMRRRVKLGNWTGEPKKKTPSRGLQRVGTVHTQIHSRAQEDETPSEPSDPHILYIYIIDWSISPHSVLNGISDPYISSRSGDAMGVFVSVIWLTSVCDLLILAVNTLTLKGTTRRRGHTGEPSATVLKYLSLNILLNY